MTPAYPKAEVFCRKTETDFRTCHECSGTGSLYSDNGPSGRTEECHECGGAGSWPEDTLRFDDETAAVEQRRAA